MNLAFSGVLGVVASTLVITAAMAQTQTSNITLKVATFGGHSGEVEASYVGSRFTRTTEVKVEWIHGNPSDHFAKMLAARGREAPFDIVLLDDAVQNAAIKAGLVAKLDAAQVPNLNQLYPQAVNKQGYGPWVILYSVGIVYNKDKLKAAGIPEPTSWEDLESEASGTHFGTGHVAASGRRFRD